MAWVLGLFIVACFVTVMLLMLAVAALVLSTLIQNTMDAKKYRILMAEYEKLKSQPSQGGWKLTYKDGRKKRSTILPGTTESEAMAAALKMGVRYDHIIALEKI